MKPRDIQRGIASRHDRSGGAPDIGRVSRVRGPDMLEASGQYRRRSSGVSSERKKLVMIWSVGLGVVAFAVMVVACFLWLRPMLQGDHSVASLQTEESDETVRIASKFPSPTREEAIRLVKDALANRDPARIEILFRIGTSTPQEIMDYCAGAPERDGTLESYDWLSSLDSDGLLIEGVVVNYKKTEKSSQRLALLTPDADGRWRLDFDAFSRKVTPTWSELLAGGGDHALVRVAASPDVYYNGPFRDESEWACYSMRSPDTEELLRGYCRVGSAEAEAMKKLFCDGATSARVTLEISRVKDGESRQFEISSLLAKDWIVVEKPGKG
ncbi:MAG: hypothetical protein ABIS50_18110 [Luteolibacter sp.]|uniref:hypothetical protein n=1 Tax=Luteolibacter sp. TaxID=1962973 RepID=UPI003262F26E